MMRTYRYRMHPTAAQAVVLSSWLDRTRWLYNAALEQKRNAYRITGKSPTRYDQHKQLTELRAGDAEWNAVPLLLLRSAINRLDLAYQAFFRRVKRGEKPGFPRFRGKDWYDSFSIGRVRITGNHVHVPKLGLVKLNLYRPVGGAIRDAIVRRSAGGKWWVSFACAVGDAPSKLPVSSATGIDLGLTTFATLSSGEEIPNPRFFRHSAALLARRQQSFSRKAKGSAGRRRARVLVSKAHEHIRNQRLDHARKLACTLFARFDLIAHEDLNVKGMVQHETLSKSVSDAGWSSFIHCLHSKAESAGKYAIAVNPRCTTRMCSKCGADVPKTLAERQHVCPCGLVMGRDHNAAVNILRLGQSLVASQDAPEA